MILKISKKMAYNIQQQQPSKKMASQGGNEMERKIDPPTNQTISEVDRTSK